MSQPPVDSPTHAAAVNDALVEATVNTEVAEAEAVSVDAYVPSSNSARSIETHHSSFAQETLQSRFICLSPSPGRGQHSRVQRRTEVRAAMLTASACSRLIDYRFRFAAMQVSV